MTPLAWLIVFFFILLGLSILVYVLVVRAFYWGDKKGPPPKRKGPQVRTGSGSDRNPKSD